MQLVRERNPRLARRLPVGTGAALRLVTRERTLNREIADAVSLDAARADATSVNTSSNIASSRFAPSGPERVREFCDRTLARLDVSVKIEGGEHLRDADRPIVCANHPTGGVDGLALISAIIAIRGRCRVPANDLLNLVTPLQPVILPVNRGRPSRERVASLLHAFQGADPILVFPAGVTARIHAGVLKERAWESTFVTRARQTGRALVPVHVSGRNSRRFYLIHRVRTALGIDFNLEMALLVDELFRRGGETVVLRFLPPRYAGSTDRNGDRVQATAIRREVERAGKRRTETQL